VIEITTYTTNYLFPFLYQTVYFIDLEASVKNKFFTRKFVPAAQSLQGQERHGCLYERKKNVLL